jgi:CheY-like chemotaxis protein
MVTIEPRPKERIFERFERAVSSSNYGGLGSGLWIARQVVDAHAGAIDVDSEPGRGATFTVTLPLSMRALDRRHDENAVTVIEEDADLREAICLMLYYEGYEASGFSNAREASHRLEDGHQSDVILLDLMMPVMNGWEFCEYRAEAPALARLPVIVITARRAETPPPGVSDVLLKPFDADELYGAISRVLAGSSMADGR